jgi:cobaltochelatase CobS
MLNVTIQKGHATRALDTFVMEVKFLPTVGETKAKLIYAGAVHNMAIPPEKAAMTTKMLLRLEKDGVLIVTGLPRKEEIEEMKTLPIQTPAPVLVNPVPAGIDDNAAALLELLRKLNGGISESRVLELIRDNAARPAHVTIDLTAPGVTLSGDSVMHHKFPLLAAAVAARVNIMLVGPAGSGKTTAAAQVAKALGLPFYGTGAINTEYKLSGFIDAQGRVISTAFRKAFEHGGVFLFDEIDGSLPGALLAFNSALANDWYDFPDANIKRHDDFRVIAGANTFGTGADRQYVGRNQLDAASLDRYAVLEWGYDEALEAAMIGADAPKGAPVPRSIEPLPAERVQAVAFQWVERVRKVRHAVGELKIRHVVSPRATVNGARLLAAGFTWAEAEDAVVWKGLDADTRGKVIAKAA